MDKQTQVSDAEVIRYFKDSEISARNIMTTDKFANKYRISSARLENWDYRLHSAYFVTIITKNRKNYFGRMVNGKMNLSGAGIIADILWYDMVRHSKIGKPDTFVVMPDHIHGIVIISNNVATAPGGQNPDQGNTGADQGSDRGVVGGDTVDWNADRGVVNRDPVDWNGDRGVVGGDTVDWKGDRGVVGGDTVDWNAVETLHATSLPPCDPSTGDPSTCDPKTRQLMAGISPKPGSLSAIIRSYKSAVTRHANRLGFPFAWQPRFHDHIIRNENEYLRIHHYILNNPKNWPPTKKPHP
ncbi:MAG: transposase [Bacteroidota bacterium]